MEGAITDSDSNCPIFSLRPSRGGWQLLVVISNVTAEQVDYSE